MDEYHDDDRFFDCVWGVPYSRESNTTSTYDDDTYTVDLSTNDSHKLPLSLMLWKRLEVVYQELCLEME